MYLHQPARNARGGKIPARNPRDSAVVLQQNGGRDDIDAGNVLKHLHLLFEGLVLHYARHHRADAFVVLDLCVCVYVCVCVWWWWCVCGVCGGGSREDKYRL